MSLVSDSLQFRYIFGALKISSYNHANIYFKFTESSVCIPQQLLPTQCSTSKTEKVGGGSLSPRPSNLGTIMGTSNPCFSKYLCVSWLPCIFKITSSALVERNNGTLAKKHPPSTNERKRIYIIIWGRTNGKGYI